MLQTIGRAWMMAFWLALIGCDGGGSSRSIPDSSTSPGAAGASSVAGSGGGTALPQAGSAAEPTDAAPVADAEPAPESDAAAMVDDPGRCPRSTLGNTLPLSYSGSTEGLADLVQSVRLEWRDAPDDTLLFVVPVTGRYRFSFEDPSSNDGCGVSIGGADWFYDTTFCPSPGSITELEGSYVAGGGFGGEIDLISGQELLIFVSCAYWSDVQAGAYRLLIERP